MKHKWVIVLLCYVCLLLSACGIKAPNEVRLKELIPDDVLQYTYDGASCCSSVLALEIVRQRTEERRDVSECKIVLEDENIRRTAYITLRSAYWDKGGWMLDSWSPYQDETFELVEKFNTDRFIPIVCEFGYQYDGITALSSEDYFSRVGVSYTREEFESTFGEEFDVTDEHIWQAYDVYDQHQNMLAVGSVVAFGNLVSTSTYPKEYSWILWADDSAVDYTWTIEGKWYGSTPVDYPHTKYISTDLTVVDIAYVGEYFDTKQPFYCIRGDANTQYSNYNVEHLYIEGQGYKTHAKESGKSPRDLCLIYELFSGKPDYFFKIYFYADEATCVTAHYGLYGITEIEYTPFQRVG